MTDLEKVQKTLERIVVVETENGRKLLFYLSNLSVSSNGSWWLKLLTRWYHRSEMIVFQYPRTDRGG